MRLAILSDIHEDFPNLQKVMRKIEKKGSDMIICLGDISGFSPKYYRYGSQRNASACLELLRNKCEIIVPGNHDLHVTGRIPPLPEEATYDYWKHDEDLDPGYSEEEKAFLTQLPDYWIIPDQAHGIMLSHYVKPNLYGIKVGFFCSREEYHSHFQLMQDNKCLLSFTGHTHARGFYSVTSTTIEHYGFDNMRLNPIPLIIGIPPVTRNNLRSGFCIFDTDTFHLQVIKLN